MMACPDSIPTYAPFFLSLYFPICSDDDDDDGGGDSAEWVEGVANE